jgi:hypothetical protein
LKVNYVLEEYITNISKAEEQAKQKANIRQISREAAKSSVNFQETTVC